MLRFASSMTTSMGTVSSIEECWRVHLARGARCLKASRYDEAQTHFFAAHRLAPERAETCLALGREYLRRGKVEQAEPLLRYACRIDPHLVSAVAALARLIGLGL